MSYDNVNVVMIVGQQGRGKTTALNHLFGLSLDTSASNKSMFMPLTVNINDIRLIVIDTPGLESSDLQTRTALDKIQEYVGDLDFTLIYCLSVAPSDNFNSMDKNIIDNLNKYLHESIWKKCLILLTFSDDSLDLFDEDSSKYIRHLQTCSQEFGCFLKTKISDCPEVKTIFDYHSERRQTSSLSTGIVALPVARAPTNVKIMPGIHLQDGRWTSAVIRELLKKLTPPDLPGEYMAYPGSDYISNMISGAIRMIVRQVSRPSIPFIEPKSKRDKQIYRLLQLIRTQNAQ